MKKSPPTILFSLVTISILAFAFGQTTAPTTVPTDQSAEMATTADQLRSQIVNQQIFEAAQQQYQLSLKNQIGSTQSQLQNLQSVNAGYVDQLAAASATILKLQTAATQPSTQPTQRTYVVLSPNNVQTAISLAQKGDTIVLFGDFKGFWDLTGKDSITITSAVRPPAVTVQADGTLMAATISNVTLDATGSPAAIFGGTNITIKGIKVIGCSNALQKPAIVCGNDWNVEDVIVDGADTVGIGTLPVARNVTWNRVVTQNNGYLGYNGNGSHFRISYLLSQNNNTGRTDPRFKAIFGQHLVTVAGKMYVSPGWEAGGGKLFNCDDVIMDHSQANNNVGFGNWLDWHNTNITVQNSAAFNEKPLLNNYDSIGFMSEANVPGPIKYINCTSTGNNGGFVLAETANGSITGCRVLDSIYFRNMLINGVLREGGCNNLTVTGNTFVGTAKLYTTAFTAAYIQANKIVTAPNTMGGK